MSYGIGSLTPVTDNVPATPEMCDLHGRALELTGRLVTRSQLAGAVRQDVTAADVWSLLTQLGRQNAWLTRQEDDLMRQRLLTITLAGLRPQPDQDPLPGEPLDTARYKELWRVAE
ncbi:hypothetical protein [Micromonospora sp. KC723]|uniref:SbtR family transcriptional regulator n=1 Tax=Micromonospora sp. KC723 TaxID=2530381 RepID=UPI0010469C64|nr:hypothetical protein [Micromonospora sp. KC723]TDB75124.1 hypothetical protein E1165_12400 [Micromonospora sp. KC723]